MPDDHYQLDQEEKHVHDVISSYHKLIKLLANYNIQLFVEIPLIFRVHNQHKVILGEFENHEYHWDFSQRQHRDTNQRNERCFYLSVQEFFYQPHEDIEDDLLAHHEPLEQVIYLYG